MIVSFSVENWRSFREECVLSMVASRERQHGDRVSRIGKYQTRILPVAAIYGGNASGKTNLFMALRFAKWLVVKGTQTDGLIPVERFQLDDDLKQKPARFKFELLIDELIYEFSFAITEREVSEERLILITSSSEKELYARKGAQVSFHPSLERNLFLNFAFKGTRENQLFITNSVSQKVDDFRPVYDWFKESLELIAPDSRFQPFEHFLDEGHPLYEAMNELLPQLDTGIKSLGGENVPLENVTLPESLKSKLQEEVKEGMTVRLMGGSGSERLVFSRKNGDLTVKRLVSYHPKVDGTNVKFEIQHESDGSQRVIDLLPAFLSMSDTKAKKVYVIDEVDRSMHTLLTRSLIEGYLANCSGESRTQLLFTTHDMLLMDQQLFRRDEMWVTERNAEGGSTLTSFSEYKDVRYDKDLRKSYLQGRLGGVPHIPPGESLLFSTGSEASQAERS